MSGKYVVLIILFALLLWQPFYAWAGPVIQLRDKTITYTIGDKVDLLEDPSGKLGIKEVQLLDSAFARSTQEVPVYGPTLSAVWCRFKVHNNSPETNWFLEVGSSFLYEADVYRQNAAGNFELVSGGAKEAIDSRSIRSNRILLPLALPAGAERVFYARFRSRNILLFPLQLTTLPTLYESSHTADLVNGIYFGMLLALMMYNLFVYITLRDRAYLYYILFILSVALDVACLKGYLLEWLPASLTWFAQVRFFCGIAILFSILFANAILQVKQFMPWLYPWRWLIFGSWGVVLLLNLLQLYVWSFTWMLLTFIPVYLYVFGAGITIYRKGFEPALYYTLGSAAIGLGILIYILKDNNLIPNTPLTESALQLGSFVEAVVLSYALASKFNLYKREKEQAQALAVKQATAFSQQLIESQEHERKRIAAELHDSVGQSLILIKNRVLLIIRRAEEPPKVLVHAESLAETVTHAINEVRSMSYGLRPFQLDMLGLTQSVDSLASEVAEASGIDITVQADLVDDIFPKNHEINIYRIVQECLNNIVKHSGATAAHISIIREEPGVQLCIADNGKGMMQAGVAAGGKNGFGLVGIQERLNILSGKSHIKAAVPHGTVFDIFIPVPVEAEVEV